MKKLLYIGGPLFNESEREFGSKLKVALQSHFNIYLPHEDGPFFPELIAREATATEARRQIFLADIEALRKCTIFLIILNGRVVDEGAAFELGVAWTLQKTCVGLKDDFRTLTPFGDNPMIVGSLGKIFTSIQEVQSWARHQ